MVCRLEGIEGTDRDSYAAGNGVVKGTERDSREEFRGWLVMSALWPSCPRPTPHTAHSWAVGWVDVTLVTRV